MNKIRNTNEIISIGLYSSNIIVILLVLNLLSTNFGFIISSAGHLISILLILGVIFLNLPLRYTILTVTKKNPNQIKLIISLGLCLGGFLLLILSKTQLLWISSIPVLLSGLDLCLQALELKRYEIRLLAVASFGYALVFLLLQTVPVLWQIYQQSSLLISHTVGFFTGIPLLLGPTTSGLGIILIFLILLLSCFFNISKNIQKFLWLCLCIGGVFFLWLLYLILLDFIFYPSSDAMNLHPLLFCIGLIPVFIFILRNQSKELSPLLIPQKIQLKKLLKNGAVWGVVLMFISIILLTMMINTDDSFADHKKILFYGSNMLGTWDVPEYGKYGKDAVGMFGLWPVYLTTLGYETEIIVQNRTRFLGSLQQSDQNITTFLNLTDYTIITETDKITKTILDGTSVFIVSNLNISFSKEEQTIIWEYVKEGGSLLVIGDHTNVGGIQNPLNDLLAPVAIRYRFDAALPLDEKFKWLTCLNCLYHPIILPLISLDEIQYGTGASLDVSPSSFPIVIGASALSDNGNRSNADIAYLGDYEYNKGEQLGDVILVAGSYYGEGKVLVFGDTSSFQNPALPFSFSFIYGTFSWLTSKQTGMNTIFQIGISVFFLLSAVLIYYFLRSKSTFFAIFPIFLSIALLLSMSINPILLDFHHSNFTENIVFIDTSHNERFSLESFTDVSVNGLIINLHRNNLLPILLREFSQEKILTSEILFFIAPTKTFTTEEVTFLQSYMTKGGVIILATGYDDKDASLPLLKAFDVDIDPTPLGPVPYVEDNQTLYQNEPRFVDSWPISFQQNQAISFYNFSWNNLIFHLVVFIKCGKGGLLIISDSQYLLDRNIESIYDYWPGNILFLKYLLDEIQTMEGR